MREKEIVEQILSCRPDLLYEQVLRMIAEKKKEAEDFFTDEAAARIVALELGVKIIQDPIRFESMVKDLVSGLNDVTVAGRVIIIYPPRTYIRRDLTEAGVARLIIGDASGTLRVVLWDDKAEFAKNRKIREGQIIKVSHGYVREGIDGKIELHVGLRGNLHVSPPDATERQYPPITSFIKNLKVSEIKEGGFPVIVEGTIATTPIIKEVVTLQNQKIKVASFELRDDTGKITVSTWRKLVEIVKDLTIGTRIKIKKAYVRRRGDKLELSSRTFTTIEVLTQPEG